LKQWPLWPWRHLPASYFFSLSSSFWSSEKHLPWGKCFKSWSGSSFFPKSQGNT
jgi:hypothetical protein